MRGGGMSSDLGRKSATAVREKTGVRTDKISSDQANSAPERVARKGTKALSTQNSGRSPGSWREGICIPSRCVPPSPADCRVALPEHISPLTVAVPRRHFTGLPCYARRHPNYSERAHDTNWTGAVKKLKSNGAQAAERRTFVAEQAKLRAGIETAPPAACGIDAARCAESDGAPLWKRCDFQDGLSAAVQRAERFVPGAVFPGVVSNHRTRRKTCRAHLCGSRRPVDLPDRHCAFA